MYLDVVDLRAFYAAPAGVMAKRLIGLRIHKLWPDVAGLDIAGIGYAPPFVAGMRRSAARVLALMPAAQGVLRWPAEGRSSAALVDETDLPLTNGALDSVLIAHALEVTHDPGALLSEAWRVLKPGGRIIVIVPNRRGVWARSDLSPFGYGRPYSRPQLARLLTDAEFTPRRWVEALYVPPFRSRFLLGFAPAFERLGALLRLPVSGVLIVEAEKTTLGIQPVRVKPLQRRVPRLAGEPAIGAPRRPAEG